MPWNTVTLESAPPCAKLARPTIRRLSSGRKSTAAWVCANASESERCAERPGKRTSPNPDRGRRDSAMSPLSTQDPPPGAGAVLRGADPGAAAGGPPLHPLGGAAPVGKGCLGWQSRGHVACAHLSA